MSAQVESMFAVNSTPWHGLGRTLAEAPTVRDAIKQSGLDWSVHLEPLFTKDGETVSSRAVRRSDGKILGTVGPNFTPLQNADAFDWFDPFVESGLCKLNTAGSLAGGKRIWVLAELARDHSQVVRDDRIAKFLMLSNSHDGSMAIRVGFTPIRIVCANTLAAAHSSSASKLVRVRHTQRSKQNLDLLRTMVDTINAEFEATAEQYRFLASKEFNQSDITRYVKAVLGFERITVDQLSKRTRENMDAMLSMIENERQSMPGVRGTWWAAYNGANEYLNYKIGKTSEGRMNSLWFGQNAKANSKALAMAMEFATAV